MGVHGLWKLLEPAGKPVPVETLENKVLAVDVSIWLHQLVKGFQDSTGSSLPNAHLLGLYHRVCKLLFFKIKPVFVFDGGVPVLKKRTMAARQNQKSKAEQASEKVREQLLKNLLKQKAVSQVLEEIRGEKISPKKKLPDMFELPPVAEDNNPDSELDDTSSSSSEENVKPMRYRDLHSIDVKCQEFKALPADIRHDILTELKETRKESSWGRLHEMPEMSHAYILLQKKEEEHLRKIRNTSEQKQLLKSKDFSTYQMERLLTRRSVQVSLEEAEKEMGGRTLNLGDIETMLKEGGVDVSVDIGNRIASDNTTRYLYVNKLDGTSTITNQVAQESDRSKPSADENNSSGSEIDHNELKTIEEIYLDNDASSDSIQENIKSARQYMMANSDLSQEQILAIIQEQSKLSKSRFTNINAPSTSKQSQAFDGLLDNEEINRSELAKDSELGDIREKSIVSSNDEEVLVKSEPVTNRIKLKDTRQGVASKIMRADLNLKNEIEEQTNLQNIKEDIPFNQSKHLVIKEHTMISDENKHIIKSNINAPISKVRADILKSLNVQLKELSKPLVQNQIKLNSPTVNLDFVDEVKTENESSTINESLSVPIMSKNIAAVECDDVFVQTLPKTEIEEEQIGVISSSDSDSEFVDVPSPTTSLLNETIVQQENLPCIQVQIEPKDVCEDDIFADIFGEKSENINDTSIESVVIKSSTEESIGFITNFVSEIEKAVDNIKSSVKLLNETKTVTEHKVPPVIEKETILEDMLRPVVEIEPIKAPYFVENEEIRSNDDTNQSVEATSNNRKLEEIVSKPKLSSKQLLKLQNILETKETELLAERGKEERTAATITEQMYVEAQVTEFYLLPTRNKEETVIMELLQLFGVPYVVAPMEAEAQCAFLDSMGLTQGTITDDSDIWLFGGRKVYKNFFSQNKYVLQFQSDDIHHFFKLARTQLVLLALLVGSDYTVGVQGVGPVTALEILASFPPPLNADGTNITHLLDSLEKFKQWLKSSPSTSLGKKLKDVQLQPGFPSPEVVKAYLSPTVDESTETFSWGTPDLDALREFAGRKFGWNQSRSDSVLLPVMKKLAEKNSQKTIDNYFQSMPNIPAHREQMSVRVQRAVHRIGGGTEDLEPLVSRRNTTRGSIRSRGRGRNRGRGRANEEEVVRSRIRERSEFEPPPSPPTDPLYSDELIPQREQDRLDSLKRKMNAIEVMKGCKKGRGAKNKRKIRQEKPEAKLSESSGEDEKIL